MTPRVCAVGFVGTSGIRHTVDVEAETLYEAVVLAVTRFPRDIWGEAVGPGTQLDVEVREPSTRHIVTLPQVERWPGGVTATPSEASKKAKLKMMLVQS